MNRISQLEALLDDSPDDPFILYALAREYQGIGQTMKAIMLYEDLITRFPDYIGTYYHYAGLLYTAGNRREAAGLLRTGIERGKAAGEHHAVSEMMGLLNNWEIAED
jgi:tetratricopeptide (TPR) repeat protein